MFDLVDKKVERRFWEKVVKTKGCWNWVGGKCGNGYGSFHLGKGMVKSNRLAWVLSHGRDIPDGLHVLHTCDNPKCCKPSHLFLGTHQDNMADMVAKGRSASIPGEANVNSKLTNKQVREIKRLYVRGGLTQRQVAKKFNLVHSTVGAILRGGLWKHRHKGINLSRKNIGETNNHSSLTEEKVAEMRKLHSEGIMQKDLVAKFGVSKSVVCEIINGKAWAHTYDGVSKGRKCIRAGSDACNSILTEDKVKFIRTALRNKTHTGASLAREFGVHTATVSAIKHKRLWAHVA